MDRFFKEIQVNDIVHLDFRNLKFYKGVGYSHAKKTTFTYAFSCFFPKSCFCRQLA